MHENTLLLAVECRWKLRLPLGTVCCIGLLFLSSIRDVAVAIWAKTRR
jgi:hypothetical protein